MHPTLGHGPEKLAILEGRVTVDAIIYHVQVKQLIITLGVGVNKP